MAARTRSKRCGFGGVTGAVSRTTNGLAGRGAPVAHGSAL